MNASFPFARRCAGICQAFGWVMTAICTLATVATLTDRTHPNYGPWILIGAFLAGPATQALMSIPLALFDILDEQRSQRSSHD